MLKNLIFQNFVFSFFFLFIYYFFKKYCNI